MMQTFLYETETVKKSFQHTIHSVDIKSSIDKWVRQIEDQQNQFYSFDINQVQIIKEEFSNGQLKIHIEREPFFLTYKVDNKVQVVRISKVTKGLPDFIAKVAYLTTQQGGRNSYAASGYRPHVKFDGRKELTTGEQIFIEKDKVLPGETVTAEVRILGVDFFKNYLFVGQHFEVAEASHLVGHGEILEIINTNLKASR